MARALCDTADVRVLTTDALLPEVIASGVEGVSLVRVRDEEIDAIVNPPRPVRSHPVRLLRQFRATLTVLRDLGRAMETELTKQSPDLVIVDSVLPTAGYAALRAGVPWWTSLASPCALEPRRGAPGYLGGWKHRDDIVGHVRDRAGLAFVRAFKRTLFRLHRARICEAGVPHLYRKNGDEAAYSPERILGLGMTELEFPRAWPRAFSMIGPMLYTPPIAAAPVTLEAERRHVLVSFGTHLGWMKDAAAARVRRAGVTMLACHCPYTQTHVATAD
jgi:UDP:flavonoid glycosyltransferase YjiC (YdhE family)